MITEQHLERMRAIETDGRVLLFTLLINLHKTTSIYPGGVEVSALCHMRGVTSSLYASTGSASETLSEIERQLADIPAPWSHEAIGRTLGLVA